MVKESNEAILEQLHEHLDEFFKAVKAGNMSISEFVSAKSLARELMANHAQQPTKRFMGKGAWQYNAPIAHSYMRQQVIELNMSSLSTWKN